MALVELTNKISLVFEEKKFLIGIFLDLSKAFDSINHKILLNKMERYGIRGTPLKWFRSYVSDRKQYTFIDNHKSDLCNISVGVPQGSVLGPLLFLMFINDLQFISDVLYSIIFADDTSLFISGNDVAEVNNVLNVEMKNVTKWFSANRLAVNIDKTCYMILKPKNKFINEDLIQIFIGDCLIRQVKQTKCLGVTIDDKITWKLHINDICLKISQAVGVMYRLRTVVPMRILLTLYYTMILPYLSYCNIVWGNSALYLRNRIGVLQKRAIRVICNSQPLAHTTPLFQQLSILKVDQMCSLQTAIFMYSYFKNILPDSFNNYFTSNCTIHSHSTRNSNHLRLPLYKYSFSQTTISYTGVKSWNSIPVEIKNSPTLSNFKRKFKLYILHKNNSQTYSGTI